MSKITSNGIRITVENLVAVDMYKKPPPIVKSVENLCRCLPLYNMVDIAIEDELNLSFITYYGKDFWNVLIRKENYVFISFANLVLSNIRHEKAANHFSSVDYLNVEDLCLASNVLDQINIDISSDNKLLFQTEITKAMRSMLITWISEIWEDFDISESVIHLTVTLIDSILLLSCDERIGKRDKFWLTFVSTRFQLLGW